MTECEQKKCVDVFKALSPEEQTVVVKSLPDEVIVEELSRRFTKYKTLVSMIGKLEEAASEQ